MRDYTISRMEILCFQGRSRPGRDIVLEVGKEYKIIPQNPSWMIPNAGRRCIIQSILVCWDGKEIATEVRFTDDDQTERVDPCLLIELKPGDA